VLDQDDGSFRREVDSQRDVFSLQIHPPQCIFLRRCRRPLSVGIQDGNQPTWLEGTRLACGAYVSDIPGVWTVPSQSPGLQLEATTDLDGGEIGDEVAVTFTETEGKAVDTTRTPITLVWLAEGRVIGVGRDVWSEPVENLQVGANGQTSVVVPVEPDRTCLTDPEAGLPEGMYDLRALTELHPGSDGARQFVAGGLGYSYFPGN